MPSWVLYSLLAILSWGIWAVLSRMIGDALSPAQSQSLSTIGLLPVMLAMAPSAKGCKAAFARRGIGLALIAGIFSCFGNLTYYKALNSGAKAALIVPLTALYPLVTILLAVLILKERLRGVQLAGIVFSLAAIYLFNVQKDQGFLSPLLLFALWPILFWGIAGLFQKLATNHIPGEAATFWFLGAFLPVGIAIILFEPLLQPVPSRVWILAGALGLSFALGNFALLLALSRDGKASIITPLTALYPLVSIPIALIAFQESIGPRETIGVLLALVAVVALSWESPASKTQLVPGKA